MATPTESQRQQWIAQWRSAEEALARVRLRELWQTDLARVAADLEGLCLEAARLKGLSSTSGLVEQQRLLHRRGHG